MRGEFVFMTKHFMDYTDLSAFQKGVPSSSPGHPLYQGLLLVEVGQSSSILSRNLSMSGLAGGGTQSRRGGEGRDASGECCCLHEK